MFNSTVVKPRAVCVYATLITPLQFSYLQVNDVHVQVQSFIVNHWLYTVVEHVQLQKM